MNKEKNKLDCAIVKDLLPLYCDNVVSETTKKAVKDHLFTCEECLKEYRTFCIETPNEKEENTGKRFGKMMGKQKIRQRIKMAVAAVMACLVLAGTYTFLTQVCLVCKNDMEVHRAFQYTTEEGEERFLLLYSTEPTSFNSVQNVKKENEKLIYEMKLLRPIIQEKSKYDRTTNVRITDVDNCSEFVCEGKTVWKENENTGDEIPDYVYAFEYYFGHDREKLAELIGEEFNTEMVGFFVGDRELGFYTEDTTEIRWNFDGEIIYDTRNK